MVILSRPRLERWAAIVSVKMKCVANVMAIPFIYRGAVLCFRGPPKSCCFRSEVRGEHLYHLSVPGARCQLPVCASCRLPVAGPVPARAFHLPVLRWRHVGNETRDTESTEKRCSYQTKSDPMTSTSPTFVVTWAIATTNYNAMPLVSYSLPFVPLALLILIEGMFHIGESILLFVLAGS